MARTPNRSSLAPLASTRRIEVPLETVGRGSALRARVLAQRSVAYTTIMTVMKKLADKGYLTYEPNGPAYVYRAARPPERVRHSLLDGILQKVFGGSPVELVASLVRHEALTDAERDAIRRLIDELDDPAHPDGRADA